MLLGKQQYITKKKKHELGELSELGELGEPVELGELSELGVLGELANSKPRNLTKILCTKHSILPYGYM